MRLPKRVTIELTNRCNRSCKGCPRLKTTYPEGDMNPELFDRIIKQLPPVTVIVPFFRGESLLHPQFEEFMAGLKNGGFTTIQLATNGDPLNISNAAAILGTCSFVSFSLHQFGYPDSVENKKILQFLKGSKFHKIETQVSILESMIPGEKEKFIRTWLDCADRVRIYVEHSQRGFGDVDEKYAEVKGYKPCNKPFEDMVIYWDGKVALCNHDWDNQIPLGNANKQTLEAIWNGPAYQEVRSLHNKGLRRKVQSCENCDYWMIPYLPRKMFGELYENGKTT